MSQDSSVCITGIYKRHAVLVFGNKRRSSSFYTGTVVLKTARSVFRDYESVSSTKDLGATDFNGGFTVTNVVAGDSSPFYFCVT